MVQSEVSNVTVYDPAAGSGTLVLALAHQIGEKNCTIYTQDISAKSNEFLRLNLILNNLVHSLGNVVHDDTLIAPRHLNARKNGLAKFNYIVSNPPFNMDFSDNRETLAGENHKERFFAGVPKIPQKKKSSMDIYLMFLQHIIYSMDDTAKAAVVVPTGFLTAGSGIQKKVREHLVRQRMLRGVVSMPSNVFANTGTNVSVLFLDKENKDGKVILMDASKLGTKEKVDGKNQKTVLSEEDMALMAEKNITAVHNPVSNLKLASGVARVPQLLRAGVNVALGTDGVASNNNHDMFEEIKLAAILHKGITGDPAAVSAFQALSMATVNGARSLGRDTGVISAGKLADLILLDFSHLNLFPCHDVLENLVFSARGSDVCMNMARGKIIYENGTFLTLDLEKIKAETEGYALPLVFGEK